MEPGDSSMAHEWARLVHEWVWSRHVAEVSQAFFFTDATGQFISVRRRRTLRHVQVGRAVKVQHPIVTNSCNDYSQENMFEGPVTGNIPEER